MLRRAAPVLQLGQNQLGRGADQEILLVDPQQPSGLVAVVGVEEQGQVPGDVALVEVDAVADDGFIYGVQVEEVQGVAMAPAAGNQDIVLVGQHRAAAEGHLVVPAGVDEPALRRDPGVGDLPLVEVPEQLVEQAVVVVEARAVAGQVQGRDGVQKAGGQTAQAAVAQGGLPLLLLDFGQIQAVTGQYRPRLVKEPQTDEVVGQQLADKKFRRDVVELPLSGAGRHLGHGRLGQPEQGGVDLRPGRLIQIGPKALG